tara:strand:+ start:582 stop:815 length:234 start_codon:yes stop_codon:yes gene_type:complete
MTDAELSTVARQLLEPLDAVLADLIDKSLRLDAERFAREVEAAVLLTPSLMETMNIDALADPLELEMGRAMVRQLRR